MSPVIVRIESLDHGRFHFGNKVILVIIIVEGGFAGNAPVLACVEAGLPAAGAALRCEVIEHVIRVAAGASGLVEFGAARADTLESGAGGQEGRGGPGRGGRNTPTDVVRLEIFARATNVLNAVNPQRFGGVLGSPFFGLPTSAASARRVNFGTRVLF